MQYSEVKELIAIFEKTDLCDMEVQLDNAKIHLSRGQVQQTSSWMTPPVPAQPSPVLAAAAPSAVLPTAAGQETKAVNSSGLVVQADDVQGGNAETNGTKVIKAPIVGTFYQSSSPEEAPFVKVGDTVAEGSVVCIIEAMKFMNEVNSEVSGTITEILVNDGDFVEYGQELFRLN